MRTPVLWFLVGGGLLGGCTGKSQETPSGAPPLQETTSTKDTLSPVAGSAAPRYQLVISQHARADTFLVDTLKGRVWQLTQLTDVPGEPVVWTEMAIIDPSGDIGETWEAFDHDHPKEGVAAKPTGKASSDPDPFGQLLKDLEKRKGKAPPSRAASSP